jgi:hypothetical protein
MKAFLNLPTRRRIRALVVMAFAILLFNQGLGDNSKTDLFLSPSQDLNTIRKAWSVKVSLDYRTSTFEEILKDLKKKTGMDIRFGELNKAEYIESLSRGVAYQEGTLEDFRGIFFLGAADGKNAQSADFWMSHSVEKRIVEFRCKSKVPLAAALKCFADWQGLDVSYRKNCIILATPQSLAPELFVTRTFQIRKGKGMTFSYVRNGEVKKFKLDFLDRVAWSLASSAKDYTRPEFTKIFENPADAKEKLCRIHPGLEIRFDNDKKELAIKTFPEMLFNFKKNSLKEIDRE